MEMSRKRRIMQAVQMLIDEGVVSVELYGDEGERGVHLLNMQGINNAQEANYVAVDGDVKYTDRFKFVHGYKFYSREYTYIKPWEESPASEEVPF